MIIKFPWMRGAATSDLAVPRGRPGGVQRAVVSRGLPQTPSSITLRRARHNEQQSLVFRRAAAVHGRDGWARGDGDMATTADESETAQPIRHSQ